MDNEAEVLVVHLGGLGDVCLSESTFLSLQKHFGDRCIGLGNRRFLDLFPQYFKRTQGIESRHWLYLFSEKLDGPHWGRIVFIGKDRQGAIRERWAKYSEDELIFIEMYPEGTFPDPENALTGPEMFVEKIHIEDYQLRQLERCHIPPVRLQPTCSANCRVILYPEEKLTKEKLPADSFLELYEKLIQQQGDIFLLRSVGLKMTQGFTIEDLADIKAFFVDGGIFVSNDSGMAHLAGACGLTTVTVFGQFDPVFWHPRGHNISLTRKDNLSVEALKQLIHEVMKCTP
jgi:hypothetical protein